MLGMMALALMAMLRIVSLAPSLTEDLFAIGVGPEIVGADSYSNRPAAAKRIPRIGALIGVSVERIVAMHPTLVVGISYQRPVLHQLQRYGIPTIVSDDDTMDDLYKTLTRLGAATHHQAQATHVMRRMHNDIAALSRRAGRLPERSTFIVIGESPIYTAGKQTFIATLASLARLRSVVQIATAPWPQYSAEALTVAAPQTIVTSDHGSLPLTPPWSDLPAVRNGCVFKLEADALLRPGPRFVDALRELIEAREQRIRRC